MIADTLDDGGRTGVPNSEAFARAPGDEQLTSRRTVQRRITEQDRRTRIVGRRSDDDPATAQPLPDVVVRLPVEDELDPAGREGTEGLSG
jgi:hypothetical protein